MSDNGNLGTWRIRLIQDKINLRRRGDCTLAGIQSTSYSRASHIVSGEQGTLGVFCARHTSPCACEMGADEDVCRPQLSIFDSHTISGGQRRTNLDSMIAEPRRGSALQDWEPTQVCGSGFDTISPWDREFDISQRFIC